MYVIYTTEMYAIILIFDFKFVYVSWWIFNVMNAGIVIWVNCYYGWKCDYYEVTNNNLESDDVNTKYLELEVFVF